MPRLPLILAALGTLALAAAGWWIYPRGAPPVDVSTLGPAVEVPSGLAVHWQDTIQNERSAAGLAYRFRFVAPGLVDSTDATEDMEALCNSFALPRLPATGPMPEQVIISISDRPVEFGETAPEVTQFFEAFRIEDGRCVWELF